MLVTGALMRKTRRRVDRRPHPHHDCDKPGKPRRRHLRETPVYSIKIKRLHCHLPKHGAVRADYGENDSDAAGFMLCYVGQGILLFGTALDVPKCKSICPQPLNPNVSIHLSSFAMSSSVSAMPRKELKCVII